MIWLGIVLYYVSVMLSVLSRLSDSMVEDSSNDEYATVRHNDGDRTSETLAVLFNSLGFLALFASLKHAKTTKLIGISIPKGISLFFALTASALSLCTCLAYASGSDRLTAEESAVGLIYGATWLLLIWSSLFSFLSFLLLCFHELLGYIEYRQNRFDPATELKYSQRSHFGFHQRQFVAFLLLSMSLVFGGSLVYHWLEGWNMRLSLLFVAVLLSTIGSSPFIPTTVTAQCFTMIFFPLGAACVLFTLQLCWKRMLASFQRVIPLLKQKQNAAIGVEDQGHEIKLTLSFALVMWIFGSLVFMFTENWKFFNSLWFCFATLVTIGFGDFFPQKPASSLFLIAYVFLSFGAVSSIMQSLSKIYAGKIRRDNIEREKRKREAADEQRLKTDSHEHQLEGRHFIRRRSSISADPLSLAPPLLPVFTIYSDVFLHEFTQLNNSIVELLPAESLSNWQIHAEFYEKLLKWKIRMESHEKLNSQTADNSKNYNSDSLNTNSIVHHNGNGADNEMKEISSHPVQTISQFLSDSPIEIVSEQMESNGEQEIKNELENEEIDRDNEEEEDNDDDDDDEEEELETTEIPLTH